MFILLAQLGLREDVRKNNWYGPLTKRQKTFVSIIHKKKRKHNKSNNKLLNDFSYYLISNRCNSNSTCTSGMGRIGTVYTKSFKKIDDT